MTSFYENSKFGEQSGLFTSPAADMSSQFLNIYSSRSKLIEMNQSQTAKSPSKDLDKALTQMFKGFSFYSEPIEEAEVQRQIKEYMKMKSHLKKVNV